MGNYPQYRHHPYISFTGLRVPRYPGHRHRRRWRVRAPRPLDQARPFFYLFIYFFLGTPFFKFFFLGTPSPPLPGSGSSGSVSPPAALSPRLPRSLSCQNTFLFLSLSLSYFHFHFLSVSPPAARSPRLPRSLVKTPSFHLSCCACALSARVRLPPAGVNAGLICSRAPFFAAWGASAACLNQPNLGHY